MTKQKKRDLDCYRKELSTEEKMAAIQRQWKKEAKAAKEAAKRK